MRFTWFLLPALLFLSASCASETSLLIIDLRTDLVPAIEFDEVRVDIIDAAGGGAGFAEHPATGDEAYLDGVRVAELEDLEAGSITVRVTMSLGGNEVMQRPVRVQLEGRLAVTVVMTRDCLDVACPAAEDPAAVACLSGVCVEETCVEGDPSCGEPACAGDFECDPYPQCGFGTCREGVCLFEGDSTMCSGAGICDPLTGCYAPEWPAVREGLQEAAIMGSLGEPVVRTLGAGSFSGSGLYVGGVLGPDGHVYGMPFDATEVLDFDPSTEGITFFGDLPGGQKFAGGALGPDGVIYACPGRADQWLAIDPVARTATLFGPIMDPTIDHAYVGAIAALDGMIYCIPSGATEVAVIDPAARSVSFFGTLDSGAYKYRSGVLAPSGIIIGTPAEDGRAALRIDPYARTVDTFGSVMPASRDWYGGVVMPGGDTIGLPCAAATGLKYVYEQDVIEEFAVPNSSVSTWGRGGALAPNGRAYVVPNDGGPTLEIQDVGTARELDPVPSPDGAWVGAVLAPNGRIYGIPWNADVILEIDPQAAGRFSMELLTSGWLNKL